MEQESQKRNLPAVRQSSIVEILQSGSQNALARHLREVKLHAVREAEAELKDLEYAVKSLRRDWQDQPDRRDEIEAIVATHTNKMQVLRQSIPRRISELEKTDPGVAGILLETMILSLSNYLNIGKNIRPDQIQETAELLVSEYAHLSLEHFAEVFQRAKKGQWGEIYDRLDGVVIARWLDKLLAEIRIQVETKNENQHLSEKHSRASSGSIYRVRDVLTKFFGHE